MIVSQTDTPPSVLRSGRLLYAHQWVGNAAISSSSSSSSKRPTVEVRVFPGAPHAPVAQLAEARSRSSRHLRQQQYLRRIRCIHSDWTSTRVAGSIPVRPSTRACGLMAERWAEADLIAPVARIQTANLQGHIT